MRKIVFLAVMLVALMPLSAKKHLVIGFADVCASGKVAVNRSYVNAVLEAGDIPELIPMVSDARLLRRYVKKVDVIFLTGGEDVNPAYYGATPSPYLGAVVGRRDTFEMALLKESVRQKKPIFGTCRGLQVINVFFGGSLYQDLPSEYPGAINHRQSDRFGEKVHSIYIKEDSRLYKIMGAKVMGVNSSHHQAIRDLAPGLRVSARAEDNVIEAIEGDTYPVAAVQFHPEGLIGKAAPEFKTLYANLMKLLKNRK